MKHLLHLSLVLFALAAQPAVAQVGLPVREYVNPEELVTLGRETTFPQAVEVLNGFAKRFQDKIIIDKSGRTGAIGLNIPSMAWRQALDYVVNFNELKVIEYPSYYEITPKIDPSLAVAASNTPAPKATLGSREIAISAMFFQGHRRALREIGVDCSTLKDGIVQVTNIAASNVSQEVFSIAIPGQSIGGGFEITALLSAFEANNIGDILSSPNIKVKDGETGRIQVGQDFSIKQRDFAGNVIDNFVSTGTILEVVPTVIVERDTSFIYLTISAERSSVLPDPISTIINKQQAQTVALLYSGESTVIAGLFEASESKVRRGVPFLKDLPPWVLGLRYVFGYNSVDVQHRELVIIIKAELLPTIPSRFAQPNSTMQETLNAERIRMIQENSERANKKP
jgi:type IV pilus assembly protein PilQ